MVTKRSVVLAVFLVCAVTVLSQDTSEGVTYGFASPSSILVGVRPGATMPVGESSELFATGGFGLLSARYGLTDRPELFLSGGVFYGFIPILADESLSLVDFALGAGVGIELSPRLSLTGSVRSGVYLSAINGIDAESRPALSLTGLLDVEYVVSPRLSVGLGTGYLKAFGLYDGVLLSVGGSYYLGGHDRQAERIRRSLPFSPEQIGARRPRAGEGLRVDSLNLNPVFPVFRTYYSDHAVGSITLTNQDSRPVGDVTVSLMIPEYMESPTEYRFESGLRSGETMSVELTALFADRILAVTEGTKASCDITLCYRIDDTVYEDTRRETVRIRNRNAMTWDDDRKAAAFVTARDPAVLSFAKGVASIIHDAGGDALDANLRKAIAVHEALDQYGIRYQVDPETPYAERSGDGAAVDFLQFPRQTLNYSAGDCDDLAILYASLLEALSIDTAFITVPGHIYTAFAMDADARSVRRAFFDDSDIIYRDGTAWIPVEITDRTGGFLSAWERGARQWRDHSSDGSAELLPVREAWSVYEPVWLPGDEVLLTPRDRERIIDEYLREVQLFIDREISPQVRRLEESIRESGANPRVRNRLGVLYAKYGRLNDAEREFQRAFEEHDYMPSLINLGNIALLRKEWRAALERFQTARRRDPDNPAVLVNLSRAHHELEQYRQASRMYARVQQIDPELASRYSYLDDDTVAGARAVDLTTQRERIEWHEE
jgi:tetratricopeptide (TPR) repeat protein